jgi:hypothetical protein
MTSTKVFFESTRYFKVWQYTVGHKRLLLRSSRECPPNTRIDIHFGAVSAMLLRPYYEGIVIRSPNDRELKFVEDISGPVTHGAVVYIIDGGRPSFVVSGRVQWHEDEGGSNDPSWFGHMVGTP